MTHLKPFFAIALLSVALFTSCDKEDTTAAPISETSIVTQNENTTVSEDEFYDTIKSLQPQTLEENSFTEKPPVKTVDYVDLKKYTGKWYEIAKYPNLFSIGCTCTTADYGLNDDNKSVSVFNNCTIAFTDKKNSINGNATVADAKTNAKLKVKFPSVPGPAGDYWIIDLVNFEDNTPYDFSVVSNPDRSQLFILSRTPQLKTAKQRAALYSILKNLYAQKYNLLKIQVSPQLGDCEYPE